MNSDLLAAYPVQLVIPVAWGEMDAMGHVNNTVYLRYFESVRMHYFERVGLMAHLRDHNVGPILAETRCRFRLPLDYPDQVTAGARVTRIEADRFLMAYAVVSHQHGKLAAEGDGLIVSYDYAAGRKTPLPEPIAAAIRALEGLAPGG